MTSYLIVNQWQGDKLVQPNMISLYRRAKVHGAKARFLAAQYAKELNGVDFADDAVKIDAITHNKTWYTVCAVPDSQARESFNYPQFEECQIYEV